MKIKENIKFAIIFSPVLIYLMLYGLKYSTSIGVNHFSHFDSSNIDGIISKVKIINQGSGFTLIKTNSTFVFYEYSDKMLNDGTIFTLFAKHGDSVVKRPYSDTLYLYKGHKVYRYTFQHLVKSE